MRTFKEEFFIFYFNESFKLIFPTLNPPGTPPPGKFNSNLLNFNSKISENSLRNPLPPSVGKYNYPLDQPPPSPDKFFWIRACLIKIITYILYEDVKISLLLIFQTWLHRFFMKRFVKYI